MPRNAKTRTSNAIPPTTKGSALNEELLEEGDRMVEKEAFDCTALCAILPRLGHCARFAFGNGGTDDGLAPGIGTVPIERETVLTKDALFVGVGLDLPRATVVEARAEQIVLGLGIDVSTENRSWAVTANAGELAIRDGYVAEGPGDEGEEETCQCSAHGKDAGAREDGAKRPGLPGSPVPPGQHEEEEGIVLSHRLGEGGSGGSEAESGTGD